MVLSVVVLSVVLVGALAMVSDLWADLGHLNNHRYFVGRMTSKTRILELERFVLAVRKRKC